MPAVMHTPPSADTTVEPYDIAARSSYPCYLSLRDPDGVALAFRRRTPRDGDGMSGAARCEGAARRPSPGGV